MIHKAFEHKKTDSPAQIVYMLNELEQFFRIYDPIIGLDLYLLFRKKKYAKCVSLVKRKMGIEKKVSVKVYSDENYEKTFGKGTAGHIQMNNLEIRLPKSTTTSYHKFILAIAHELAHVVLYEIKHHFKYSEVATDLLPFLFGFGKIYEVERYKNRDVKLGYLSLSDMEVALVHLETRYTKKRNVLAKISYRINRWIRLLEKK